MAVIQNLVYTINSWILYLLVIALGSIANLISKLVFYAASFSDFTTLDQISQAWMVVRDFSNMFFIIILLVIAFGTVLKIEEYSYKKLLPRMIIMAILVNFSKTICGLFIDASQVFLFTFLNAMEQVQHAGLLSAFGLHKLMIGKDSGVVKDQNVFMTLLVVLAMLAVACVVMLVYAALLILRVCMLWLLIILSPLAYVLNVLPQTQEYAKQWWKMFGNYVILGPMIAFFLWLAIFVATYKDGDVAGQMATGSGISSPTTLPADSPAALTEAATPKMMANFIIAVMLLVGGLIETSKLASEFSKITSKVQDMGTKGMMWMGRRVDDAQNLFRGGVGLALNKGGEKIADWGRNSNNRVGHLGGKFISGVGRTVGAQVTLRPSELKKAFEHITTTWDTEVMDGRRAKLKQGMAAVMAPTRWAASVFQKTQAGKISRERANAGDMQNVMKALNGGDTSGFNAQDFDKAKGVIDSVMKNLENRMNDINYSGAEKKRMEQARDDLSSLLTNVQGKNTGRIKGMLDEKDNARKNFDSFDKTAEASLKAVSNVRTGGRWFSFYAGEEDFMNQHMQSRTAEESKKLEEKTAGVAEQIVLELEDAYRSGDTAKIMAGMRSLWNSNDQNELHGSRFLMKNMRGIVEKKAKEAGVDAKAALADFNQNYTDPAYMNLLVQDVLGKAFQGNKTLMAKEAMRLDNISIEKGGGHYYGGAMVDAATGTGYFNDPDFMEGTDKDGNKKVRAMISAAQSGALAGKLSNLNARVLSNSSHPGRFATRQTVGGPGGMTSSSFTNWKVDDAEQYSRLESMRKDFIAQISDDSVFQDSIDFFEGLETSGSNMSKDIKEKYGLGDDDLKRGKIRAVIMQAAKLGELSGKEGTNFFSNCLRSKDDISVDQLKKIIGAKDDEDKKEAIREILKTFGTADPEKSRIKPTTP